ncbi:DUF4190 domain-containing protein [Streptomyces sp. SAJ15]|uniref:DUF4190 domain-containing protein n=1 Tax=Streptomyces sp. SAJ15 TaxID=2011095 RepID=UPI001185AF96|nr:DUF4190 domain-containing protein [Streptomyces sp. SAJ15]TVL94378.1 DUF4190 domain-containing protein [Streptomyces sp. SAJ15]
MSSNTPSQPGYDPNALGGHPQTPYATAPQQPPAPPQGYPGAPGNGYPGAPGNGYPVAPPAGPYPGYPGYPGGAVMPMQQSNGMGTAALVCGIIGLVCGITYFLWVFAVILGILAIIFGAVGKGKAKRGEAGNAGSATAGLVCGIIGMVIPFLYLAALGAAIDSVF